MVHCCILNRDIAKKKKKQDIVYKYQPTNKQANKLNGRVDGMKWNEMKYLNITYTETNIIWLKWDVSLTFISCFLSRISFCFHFLIEAKTISAISLCVHFSIALPRPDWHTWFAKQKNKLNLCAAIKYKRIIDKNGFVPLILKRNIWTLLAADCSYPMWKKSWKLKVKLRDIQVRGDAVASMQWLYHLLSFPTMRTMYVSVHMNYRNENSTFELFIRYAGNECVKSRYLERQRCLSIADFSFSLSFSPSFSFFASLIFPLPTNENWLADLVRFCRWLNELPLQSNIYISIEWM